MFSFTARLAGRRAAPRLFTPSSARSLSTAPSSTPASHRLATALLFASSAAVTTYTLTAPGPSPARSLAPFSPLAAKSPTVPVIDISAAISAILDESPNLGPTFVRLAWHASGTYDAKSGTGGSDGATMRFDPEAKHGANAGLQVARAALEPVKAQFPDVSYADLWTLAAVAAIEYMGGPAISWRAGRVDAASGEACTPDGRLPDADKGTLKGTIQHIRDIFYRMGFNDQEIVALVGAHSLGRCHADRSGYSGPWDRAPTTFSNLYFKELLGNTWTLKKWDGPDQFEDPTGELMMLPSDMAMIWDKDFRKYVETYAKDEDLFFKDFAAAFQKLEELGVKALQPKKKSFFGLF